MGFSLGLSSVVEQGSRALASFAKFCNQKVLPTNQIQSDGLSACAERAGHRLTVFNPPGNQDQRNSNPTIQLTTVTPQQPAVRATIEGEHHHQCPQASPQTTEVLIEAEGVCQVQPQFQSNIALVDASAQISGLSLDPSSIQSSMGLQVSYSGRSNHKIYQSEQNASKFQDDMPVDEVSISMPVDLPLCNTDPGNLEVSVSSHNTHQISEHNTGGLQVDHTIIPVVDLEPEVSQTSLPESPEQNPDSVGDIVVSTSHLNQSNPIRHLVFLAACNFFSNARVGVSYLRGDLRKVHGTYQRVELISSVGAPIAVALFTFASSVLFASNPERWSNWITGLCVMNAGMIVGGPLSFNRVSNRET